MPKLARINTLLLVLIVVINVYVIMVPFIPGALFWLQSNSPEVKALQHKLDSTPVQGKPTPNRLLIPNMLLDQPIHEGKDLSAARNGPWRIPYTSTPDKGDNTVIVGHRFTYSSPKGTFYHLDKLRPKDEIGIYWNNKKYIYSVARTSIVAPTHVSVEAPTNKPQLTLYTCTPLLLPKDRLVVVATLKEQPK